jgi:hypothetical protein
MQKELTTKLVLIVIGLTAGSGILIPSIYAGIPVTSDEITDGEVKTPDIGFDAVNREHILDGNIFNAEIADDAITTNKILDGEATNTDIGNRAITSNKINDFTVQGSDVNPAFIKFVKVTDSNSGSGWDPNGSVEVFGIVDNKVDLNSVVLINMFKPTNIDFNQGPQPICQVFALFTPGGFFFRCSPAPEQGSLLNYIVFRPEPCNGGCPLEPLPP